MNNYGQIGGYNVDVCLCIDKTGSMSPIINTVKRNALNLYDDITSALREKGKYISKFRVRVIWFGDYLADKEPMLISDFLTLPDDLDQFQKLVNGIKADGGGDEPEDGLEALAYAIRSEWCETGYGKRHIIALFTDAPAHELGFGRKASTYPPSGMPKDFGELSAMWGDEEDPGEMDYRSKRLLLFTPDVTFWHTISQNWENTVMRPAAAATGLKDVTYQAMLNTISNSIA